MSNLFANDKPLVGLGVLGGKIRLGETIFVPIKNHETQVDSINSVLAEELRKFNNRYSLRAHQVQPSEAVNVLRKVKQPVIHLIELDTSQPRWTLKLSKLKRIEPETASDFTLENK